MHLPASEKNERTKAPEMQLAIFQQRAGEQRGRHSPCQTGEVAGTHGCKRCWHLVLLNASWIPRTSFPPLTKPMPREVHPCTSGNEALNTTPPHSLLYNSGSTHQLLSQVLSQPFHSLPCTKMCQFMPLLITSLTYPCVYAACRSDLSSDFNICGIFLH